jgi:hypothetical protein
MHQHSAGTSATAGIQSTAEDTRKCSNHIDGSKKIIISKVHSNGNVPPTIRLQTTAGTSGTAVMSATAGMLANMDVRNSMDVNNK